MTTRRNRLQVMVEDEIFETVKELADGDGRTVSDYIRLVLEQHIKQVTGKP